MSGVLAALPVIVHTWPWKHCAEAGWRVLAEGGSALDSAEAAAKVAEEDFSIDSVGPGHHPDTTGARDISKCCETSRSAPFLRLLPLEQVQETFWLKAHKRLPMQARRRLMGCSSTPTPWPSQRSELCVRCVRLLSVQLLPCRRDGDKQTKSVGPRKTSHGSVHWRCASRIQVSSAVAAARLVMRHTKHTLLVGSQVWRYTTETRQSTPDEALTPALISPAGHRLCHHFRRAAEDTAQLLREHSGLPPVARPAVPGADEWEELCFAPAPAPRKHITVTDSVPRTLVPSPQPNYYAETTPPQNASCGPFAPLGEAPPPPQAPPAPAPEAASAAAVPPWQLRALAAASGTGRADSERPRLSPDMHDTVSVLAIDARCVRTPHSPRGRNPRP